MMTATNVATRFGMALTRLFCRILIDRCAVPQPLKPNSVATGREAARSAALFPGNPFEAGRETPAARRRSIAGPDSLDQLLHGRNEPVRVKGIGLEAEGRMAGEHQILVDRTSVRDFLEC